MRPRELAAVALAAVFPAACGSEPAPRSSAPPAAAATTGPSLPCAVQHLGSEPLLLEGGREAYVEPQALVVGQEGTLLLAGAPTYLWRRVVAPRGVVWEETNQFVAVSRNGAEAQRIAPPPGIGPIQHVRATRLPNGGWGIVMSTGAEDPDSGSMTFDGTWYAEHDGRSWSEPELLPRPAYGSPRPFNSTGLVALADRLLWILPWRGTPDEGRLVELERRHGRWTYRLAGVPGYAESLGLTHAASGDLWLAVAGFDPELPRTVRTLRLYHNRTGRWELVRRLTEVGPDAYIEAPQPAVIRGGVSVAWLQHDRHGTTAMTVLERGLESPPAFALTSDALQVVPLALHDGTPAWVVTRSLASVLSSELQLFVGTPDGPRTALALPNPYTGYFAAAVHGRRITIAGPEFDPNPAEPTVRSLIIHLGASCQ